MSEDNFEFNKAINDIIKSATGRNINSDIEAGKIENLPKNFELVEDFQPEAYQIKSNNKNQ